MSCESCCNEIIKGGFLKELKIITKYKLPGTVLLSLCFLGTTKAGCTLILWPLKSFPSNHVMANLAASGSQYVTVASPEN